MSFIKALKNVIKKYLFNTKWTCTVCGKEVFEGEYFCEDCYKDLPFNDGKICDHCGRAVKVIEDYCSTCKNYMVSLDKCRSVFVYDKAVRKLIKHAKYDNQRYLLEIFADLLKNVYFKNYFNADYLVYVPMTDKARRKRGYNQSEKLSRLLSEKISVPVLDCLVKTKETKRQAKLNKEQRLKNLKGAFKVINKKEIKGKTLVLIDDVTTTGTTAEMIASLLKKSNAKAVYLLTVASVPPVSGY